MNVNVYRIMHKTRFMAMVSRVLRVRRCHAQKTLNIEENGEIPKQRSHLCGELGLSDVGTDVTVCGWVQYRRLDLFMVLRDWRGLVQVVIPKQHSISAKLDKIPAESVVQVSGTVQKRPIEQQNQKMETGEIEVVAKDVTVLSVCKQDLPVTASTYHEENEELRMKYRYLDLRSPHMQHNLRMRSHIINKMRHFLCTTHNFVEVETPTLFRRTPGGASEFVVPSRFAGQFYTLPQSPQQFKQLLMVGGIDRYMQVARCYRDEVSKSDRQLEFTQLDLEMSYIQQEDIMTMVEATLSHSWPHTPPLTPPFPRMTYAEAMAQYGTDKPDTTFDLRIRDVTDCLQHCGVSTIDAALADDCDTTIQTLNLPNAARHLSNKQLSQIIDASTTQDCTLLTMKSNQDNEWLGIGKHLTADTKERLQSVLCTCASDVVVLAVGSGYHPNECLGKVRLGYADTMEATGVPVRDKDAYNFLWVTDFPLFLPSKDKPGKLESAHHPFTAPHPRHAHHIYTHPQSTTSQHYDLVLNGREIGGGSIRIHDSGLQRYILDTVLQEIDSEDWDVWDEPDNAQPSSSCAPPSPVPPPSAPRQSVTPPHLTEDSTELEHLLVALESGCPPHGGIALGLDRYIALLCGAKSIRDVIAFPKSITGRDTMSGSPAPVSQAQLDLYHIRTT